MRSRAAGLLVGAFVMGAFTLVKTAQTNSPSWDAGAFDVAAFSQHAESLASRARMGSVSQEALGEALETCERQVAKMRRQRVGDSGDDDSVSHEERVDACKILRTVIELRKKDAKLQAELNKPATEASSAAATEAPAAEAAAGANKQEGKPQTQTGQWDSTVPDGFVPAHLLGEPYDKPIDDYYGRQISDLTVVKAGAHAAILATFAAFPYLPALDATTGLELHPHKQFFQLLGPYSKGLKFNATTEVWSGVNRQDVNVHFNEAVIKVNSNKKGEAPQYQTKPLSGYEEQAMMNGLWSNLRDFDAGVMVIFDTLWQAAVCVSYVLVPLGIR